MTPLQAVMEQGGFLPTAKRDRVVLIVPTADGKFGASLINLEQVLTSGVPESASAFVRTRSSSCPRPGSPTRTTSSTCGSAGSFRLAAVAIVAQPGMGVRPLKVRKTKWPLNKIHQQSLLRKLIQEYWYEHDDKSASWSQHLTVRAAVAAATEMIPP